MKLELIHLAPYLPYGLKVKHLCEPESIYELSIEQLLSNDKITIESLLGVNNMIGRTVIKPILRPMSELPNHKEALQDLTVLYNLDFLMPILNKLDHSITPYSVILVLLKHHFDIYNLIDKNLAIAWNNY